MAGPLVGLGEAAFAAKRAWKGQAAAACASTSTQLSCSKKVKKGSHKKVSKKQLPKKMSQQKAHLASTSTQLSCSQGSIVKCETPISLI